MVSRSAASARIERTAEEGLEPAEGDVHRAAPAAPAARGSACRPRAAAGCRECRSAASRCDAGPCRRPSRCSAPDRALQFSSTAGCTMPQPRISIQPVPLHAGQPLPWQSWHSTSISADGSVNGKNDGRNRVLVAGAEEPVGEVDQRRLEVDERDPLVHREPFDLGERRRVRRVERVVAVDHPGDHDPHRRRRGSAACGSAPATCGCAAAGGPPARPRPAGRRGRACRACPSPDGRPGS